MRWVGETITGKDVTERRFDVECEGRMVPGLVWTPDNAEGTRPLVLIGHGGTLHKRAEYVLALARRLVRHHGIAAAAIDGPAHGEREDAREWSLDEYRQRREAGWLPDWWTASSMDDMVADWKATLEALQALPEIGPGPIGYWGVSMGTIFGLPFVAAEPRVQVAVLGLMGLIGGTKDRMVSDGARVQCPLLFLQQLEDELVPRERAVALFDAIASRDKRLHAHPGAHAAVPREEIDFSESFLSARLLATARPPVAAAATPG